MNPAKTIVSACVCLSTLLLVACSPAPDTEDQTPGPDLILINADVRTVDPSRENAEAFAIIKGKFIAVGSSDDIREMARDNTEIVDAGGVTVVPGLIDNFRIMPQSNNND